MTSLEFYDAYVTDILEGTLIVAVGLLAMVTVMAVGYFVGLERGYLLGYDDGREGKQP